MFWGGGHSSYCFDRCREAKQILGMLRKLTARCLQCPQPVPQTAPEDAPQAAAPNLSCTCAPCQQTHTASCWEGWQQAPTLDWHCQSIFRFEAEAWFHKVKHFCINSAHHLTLKPQQLQINTSTADQQAKQSLQSIYLSLKIRAECCII